MGTCSARAPASYRGISGIVILPCRVRFRRLSLARFPSDSMPDAGPVTLNSTHDFAVTEKRILDAINALSDAVSFGKVDFAARSKKHGAALEPTVSVRRNTAAAHPSPVERDLLSRPRAVSSGPPRLAPPTRCARHHRSTPRRAHAPGAGSAETSASLACP